MVEKVVRKIHELGRGQFTTFLESVAPNLPMQPGLACSAAGFSVWSTTSAPRAGISMPTALWWI